MTNKENMIIEMLEREVKIAEEQVERFETAIRNIIDGKITACEHNGVDLSECEDKRKEENKNFHNICGARNIVKTELRTLRRCLKKTKGIVNE